MILLICDTRGRVHIPAAEAHRSTASTARIQPGRLAGRPGRQQACLRLQSAVQVGRIRQKSHQRARKRRQGRQQ